MKTKELETIEMFYIILSFIHLIGFLIWLLKYGVNLARGVFNENNKKRN